MSIYISPRNLPASVRDDEALAAIRRAAAYARAEGRAYVVAAAQGGSFVVISDRRFMPGRHTLIERCHP